MTTAQPNEGADPHSAGDPAARRAQALRQARQRSSQAKREQVRAAILAMVAAGECVTFAAVARRAGVSTWLVYAPGVREHVDAAMTRQGSEVRPCPTPASAASLRTDLELARREIGDLRRERDDLRRRLRGSLDEQLTALSTEPLLERLNALAADLARERATNRDLTAHASALRDDLDASRRALRHMIKETAAGPARPNQGP